MSQSSIISAEFTLEVSTHSNGPNRADNLSSAEVMFDALSFYREKLYEDLEELRDRWAISETVTLAEIKKSCTSDDLFSYMEQIKILDSFIVQIGALTTAHLRLLAAERPDPKL